eukprot:2711438-Rhodomonas_salina.3
MGSQTYPPQTLNTPPDLQNLATYPGTKEENHGKSVPTCTPVLGNGGCRKTGVKGIGIPTRVRRAPPAEYSDTGVPVYLLRLLLVPSISMFSADTQTKTYPGHQLGNPRYPGIGPAIVAICRSSYLRLPLGAYEHGYNSAKYPARRQEGCQITYFFVCQRSSALAYESTGDKDAAPRRCSDDCAVTEQSEKLPCVCAIEYDTAQTTPKISHSWDKLYRRDVCLHFLHMRWTRAGMWSRASAALASQGELWRFHMERKHVLSTEAKNTANGAGQTGANQDTGRRREEGGGRREEGDGGGRTGRGDWKWG